jgi:uncharacterized protein
MENRTTAGAFLENFIVMEIVKQLGWSGLFLKPFHFSIHSGAEIDLILEDRNKQLYGMEIKSAPAVKQSDFNGLRRFAEIIGKRLKDHVADGQRLYSSLLQEIVKDIQTQ